MTKIHLTQIVPEELNSIRLDQTLAKLFPDYSRAQLQKWIKAGDVKIDGEVCQRSREKVQEQQHIEIDTELVAKQNWSAQSIPLNIIFEDEDLIIINKPPGLVVHPGAGVPDQTLVNALLHHSPELDKLPRAGLIHRLDKNTSGLLVIARNLTAHHKLVKAMQQREIKREYETIVMGVMIAGGTIEGAIGRHPTHRTKMAVVPTGKPATTHYRLIEKFRAHTHLRVILETGRTHQIRVHLAHIHYPIVGDPLYGKGRALPRKISDDLKKALHDFKRQALHARKLCLMHPTLQKEFCWEAPLPVMWFHILKVRRK